MAAVAATRASRRWREAAAPRAGGPCGDLRPSPSCRPATVRPGTLPCPAFPHRPHPSTPTRSSRPTAEPPPRVRTAAPDALSPGTRTGLPSEGRTRTLRRASRRRHLAVPFLFPAERERRGQAPRRSGGGSQIGISLMAAPLPPPCRPAVGRAPTYPGPSSSLECCKKQARSRGRSWGQASTGPRDEPTSLVLVWDCEGILRTPS